MDGAVKIITSRMNKKGEDDVVDAYITGNEDYLFPIVFPDYAIRVGSYSVPYLGHAGVLIANGKTGATKYYEYGRYDKDDLGWVRNKAVPNLKIKDSLIVIKSFKEVLKIVSSQSGQKGKIEGVILRKAEMYATALDWLKNKEKQNNNPDRIPYSISDNNCVTFVDGLAEEMGFTTPLSSYNTPSIYMSQFQMFAHEFTYFYNQDRLRVKW